MRKEQNFSPVCKDALLIHGHKTWHFCICSNHVERNCLPEPLYSLGRWKQTTAVGCCFYGCHIVSSLHCSRNGYRVCIKLLEHNILISTFENLDDATSFNYLFHSSFGMFLGIDNMKNCHKLSSYQLPSCTSRYVNWIIYILWQTLIFYIASNDIWQYSFHVICFKKLYWLVILVVLAPASITYSKDILIAIIIFYY